MLDQHRPELGSRLLQKTVAQLSKITKAIRDTALSVRMVSLKPTFQKMHRIVRDLAISLGKEVDLNIEGEENEVDKTILDAMSDPLVHLIRNAIDHGIELPDDREKAGKQRTGTISLRALLRSEHIVIEVADNGKGLDPARIAAKARTKGLLATNQELTEEQAFQLIFLSGFSTKDQATEVSGRGVGMDVVKTQVEQLQGKITVESKPGEGTLFRIELPLTLAIIDGMIISQGDSRYVLPLASVRETLLPGAGDISPAATGGELLRLREEVLPVVRLGSVFRDPPASPASRQTAIVTRTASGVTYALMVDDIIGQQQVVIKKLGDELGDMRGISGAAVLGDGRPALILDLAHLNQFSQGSGPMGRIAN